ncbi:YaaR family protein [Tissierella sp. MSJ-40]|uniref:YaaR family protein n=1 Tax=Tissierella simiarum TaxID=2841534 RepID=A0ABS6E2W9_9FIRM|nr:YaaR family protein [Tissierella simiarum]MBU5437171.1 YaaR family protein [Tissierella simiarum]
MTRVDRVGMENISPIEINKVKDKKAVQETFKQKLNEIEQEQIRSELKVLYDKIETQTGKLQNKLFIEDLVEYKKLVKEFLNVTVNNSHVFYKENSLDRRGRHRVYSLVKKVDNELDELTKDFLDVENNRLKILKRLDDIKGILLDILT